MNNNFNDEQKLIEKIIKEQDLVCLYMVESYNKSLDILEEYANNPQILYSQLDSFVFSHPDMIEKFSTKNLFTLLSKAYKEEDKERVSKLIAERLKVEDLFCEDIDTSVFMKVIHSYNISMNKIDKDTLGNVKSNLLKEISLLQGTEVEKIVNNITLIGDAANFLKYYKEGVFSKEKIELLENMLNKHQNSLEYVNFGIFQDEIFQFGQDFIEYLSKFPKLSYQLCLLKEKNPELLKTLRRRVSTYQNLPDNFDEMETLITYFTRNVFELQINDKSNIEDLIQCAIRSSNSFKLINVEYGENYNERLEQEYNKQYQKANSTKEKLNIYLNKVFSLTTKDAQQLLKDFGSDIDNLNDLSKETKEFFTLLQQSIKLEDEDELNKLFKNSNTKYMPTDILRKKLEVSQECAKSFASEMIQTDEKIKKDDAEFIEYNGKTIKQIKLNGKFNILLHSTDSAFINEAKLEEDTDFVKLWKNGKNKQNHMISTAYVNQDFLGTAPVGSNGVRYGFTTVDSNDIRIMGVTDINTYSTNFAYDSKTKQYMSAKTLPYNSRRVYSEFTIERQDNNPDYVVLFDDDLPEVKENTYKAATQFNVPVVFIDKEEIKQQQINNLNELMQTFEKTNDPEVLKKLINSYETNVAGWLLNRSNIGKDESHTSNIDNSRFKEEFETVRKNIETMVTQYLSVDQNKNSVKTDEIRTVIEVLLSEIELYEKCEETSPISKTHITLDVNSLLKTANSSLDKIGDSKYKVDLEKIPTKAEYISKMEELVRDALSGKEEVTISDIKEAELAISERSQVEYSQDKQYKKE